MNSLVSTRAAAGEALLELAREGMDLVVLSADTSKSMYTFLLEQDFPQRTFDVGLSEQNMMMVAAGLASTGKIVFVASYSVFMSMRCCEQLRTFIAYPGLNVNIIAGLGGLSAGIEGTTHVAVEDLGIVRCIPNLVIVAPSDATSTKKAIKLAAGYNGPVYIRIGRDETPLLFDNSYSLEFGVPILHRSGSDLTIISSGLILSEVITSAASLAQEGIEVDVIEMHTIKPILDPQKIIERAMITRKIITVEEHNIVGGLATVISEILCGKGEFIIKNLGVNDRFVESGTPQELRTLFGVDAKSICKVAKRILHEK